MGKRKVFFFEPFSFSESVSQALRASKWQVLSTHDFGEARRLLEKNDCLVGLIEINHNQTNAFLDQVADVIRDYDRTNWIAIVPKEFFENAKEHFFDPRLICDCCFDFHTLPVDMERLLISIGHAYGMAEIRQRLDRQLAQSPSKFGMIAKSATMEKLFRQIVKVAKADCSALIEGETGTGKELIAQAIHENSRRKNKPLVAVNCGALPESLIQAELFGYEKGAFTGAYERKIGRVEAANGGTLFLDEIGDLPLSQQVNLLRFLQEKTIERVGGVERIHLDVRVIAATHVNLKKAVAEGKFREDLFYRLRVLHLKVPPLRERDDDIELLAWHFFRKFSVENRHKAQGFSDSCLQAMMEYDWPGNVRELCNSVHHAVVMSENRFLTPDDLGLPPRSMKPRLASSTDIKASAK